MKTKSFGKAFVSIMLAMLMLILLIPMQAFAKTVDDYDNVTAFDFSLTSVAYAYGKHIGDVFQPTCEVGTAYINTSIIAEKISNEDSFDSFKKTDDYFFNANKQYYLKMEFQANPADEVKFAADFGENSFKLMFNGVECSKEFYKKIEEQREPNDFNTPEYRYQVVFKLPILEAVPIGIDLTTVIEQGGNFAPGEGDFEIEMDIPAWNELDLDEFTIGGTTITTDGTGSFDSKITIANDDFEKVLGLLYDGIVVRQKIRSETGWTYDETIWGVLLNEAEVNSLDDETPTMEGYPLICFKINSNYEIIDDEEPTTKITFTNTYTENDAAPKTGDNSNIMLYATLVAVAAGFAVGIGFYSKNKKNFS